MSDAFKVNDELSQALRRARVLVDLISAVDPNDLCENTLGQAGVMIMAELEAVEARAAQLHALAGGR